MTAPANSAGEGVPAVAHAQDRVGVAADHAERRLADRKLMRQAKQQNDANGADRHRAGGDADAEMIAVGKAQRIQRHCNDEQQRGNWRFATREKAGHWPPAATPARPRRNTPPWISSQANRAP